MQELLRWEIATKDKNSIRTAKLRELHTLFHYARNLQMHLLKRK